MTDIRDFVQELTTKHPRAHENNIATKALAQLSDKEIRELAAAQLASLIWEERRRRQIAAERAASREAFQREEAARKAEAKAKREERKRRKALTDEERRAEDLRKAQEMLDAENAAMTESERQYRRDLYEINQRAKQRQYEAISTIVADIRNTVTLEVTEELLATVFAVGDGRRVTWGEATIEDHRARVETLQKHALGTLESAARHEKAIEMLTAQGVSSLAELKVAA